MERLRVVLVTNRFWPLFGGAANAAAELAAGLRRRGAEPTVVTARWAEHWPSFVVYDGVPVVRLARPHGRMWGRGRYLLGLVRWLRARRSRIDVACVAKLGWEAYVTLAVVQRAGIPVIIRSDRWGDWEDDWRPESRVGRRLLERFRAADAVIVPDEAARQEFAAHGFGADRIHVIPHAVPVALVARPAHSGEARAALAAANDDLTTTAETPIVACVGRLRPDRGLLQMIEAWPTVLRLWPEARLWLVGDGPLRDELFERIRDLDLRGSVSLPGTVDDVADVLAAADVFVEPGPAASVPHSLLEAIAAGLPVVATDSPSLRREEALGNGTTLLVAPGDAPALSQAVLHFLDHPPAASSLTTARRRVLQTHSPQRTLDAHLRLFETLCRAQNAKH